MLAQPPAPAHLAEAGPTGQRIDYGGVVANYFPAPGRDTNPAVLLLGGLPGLAEHQYLVDVLYPPYFAFPTTKLVRYFLPCVQKVSLHSTNRNSSPRPDIPLSAQKRSSAAGVKSSSKCERQFNKK